MVTILSSNIFCTIIVELDNEPKLSIQFSARDCEWAGWSEWTSCSTTCDNGIRERNREKLVVEVGGGTCSGQRTESESCKLRDCDGKIIFKRVNYGRQILFIYVISFR